MDELTLRDYLKVVFRQKWVIIVTILTVMITVGIGLKLKTPAYEGAVKMLITGQKQVESQYYTELMAYQNIQQALTQSEIVKSVPVLEKVMQAGYVRLPDYEAQFASLLKKILIKRNVKAIDKHLNNPKLKFTDEMKKSYLYRIAFENLKNSIKVEPVRDTNMFTITLRDFSPNEAARGANIVSRAYVIFDLEQQLAEMQMKYGEKHLSVTQLKDNIDKMTKNLNGNYLPAIEAIGPASVKIIEQAIPPIKPTGLPGLITFILAVFMSIFLGLMLAFLFEYIDQTFKSPEDIERTLNVAFLGSIPKKAQAEAFRSIGDQIYFEIKDRGLRSLLLTAALPKEGVTTVTANIAKYIAGKSRRRALVIDANLRNPSLHKAFNISNSAGLVDVLEEKLTFDKAVMDIDDKLSILTAGKVDLNPATLVESHKMADVLKTAKDKFEFVIIDSPNIRESKDTIDIASCVDGVVLMVNEGRTRRQVAKAALASLRAAKEGETTCKGRPVVIGAILGNRSFAIPKAIYERV